jgi:hypothetical protein
LYIFFAEGDLSGQRPAHVIIGAIFPKIIGLAFPLFG